MATRFLGWALILGMAFGFSCGNDEAGPLQVEQTGLMCQSVAQCYPSIDAGALFGTATCMKPPADGYCTHTCTQDSDCCAVPGECSTDHPQVCTPFESNGGATYCMLSCETVAGDPTAYCHIWAGRSTGCASSGGGSGNRKVCKP